jgi:malate synthase
VTATQYEPIQIIGRPTDSQDRVLTPKAIEFLTKLARLFEPRRRQLLEKRRGRQEAIDNGWRPDFLSETAEIRKSQWTVAEVRADLQDRRVEITGPTSRKMIINALNSGASVFMADFEDSNSPTWENMIEGQRNLQDAVAGAITYLSPDGKSYELREDPAVLMVRPRGWHLEEKHFLVDGQPISASLFDFGLFFFHNARTLISNGTAPYFYLPKLENHEEARLWNDVLVAAQSELAISRGTIRVTVLIETLLAAFEMDEILWELRDHIAGLNCGRWDYIFSYIKKFRNHPEYLLPDRSSVTMTRHFLSSYVELLIATCHRRRAHAMGGMAAQIPIKNDLEANEAALAKVRADKLREVWAGHDGTWVAHPGLVPLAKSVFDTYTPFPNYLEWIPAVEVTAADLLCTPEGRITEEGLKLNLDVGLQYLTSWLGGNGCVPIYNLMEDAATAEICRAQVWQWLRHGAATRAQVDKMMRDTVARLQGQLPHRELTIAERLYVEMLDTSDFLDFLTLRAYDYIE